MFEYGQIIKSCGHQETDYYIVVETGRRPILQKLDNFIINNYRVTDPDTGDYYTIKEIIEREKHKIIHKEAIELDVYNN